MGNYHTNRSCVYVCVYSAEHFKKINVVKMYLKYNVLIVYVPLRIQ